MNLFYLGHMISRYYLLLIVAVLLLSAFSLHIISIDHHHPWDIAGGDRIQASLHGEDKRWLFSIACVLFLCAGFEILFFEYGKTLRRVLSRFFEIPLFFNPQRSALRTGIMHPKLCG